MCCPHRQPVLYSGKNLKSSLRRRWDFQLLPNVEFGVFHSVPDISFGPGWFYPVTNYDKFCRVKSSRIKMDVWDTLD